MGVSKRNIEHNKVLDQKYNRILSGIFIGRFYGRHHDLVEHYGISVTNDHGYIPLVVNTSQSFPHS